MQRGRKKLQFSTNISRLKIDGHMLRYVWPSLFINPLSIHVGYVTFTAIVGPGAYPYGTPKCAKQANLAYRQYYLFTIYVVSSCNLYINSHVTWLFIYSWRISKPKSHVWLSHLLVSFCYHLPQTLPLNSSFEVRPRPVRSMKTNQSNRFISIHATMREETLKQQTEVHSSFCPKE